MKVSLGARPQVFGLFRAGSLEPNPQVFAKRAGTFAAAAAQLGGSVLLVWRTSEGLSSAVLLPSGRGGSGSAQSVSVHLGTAVGAEARPLADGWCLTDVLPDVMSAPVGWLRFLPGDVVSRDSQQGADPAELSRSLAKSMQEGMWCAVLLRPARGGERRRHFRWLAYRMQTKAPVHHSVSTDAVVAAVAAGGCDRGSLRMFLAGLGSGFPGLDLGARVVTDSLAALRVRRLVGSVGLLGVAAAAAVFSVSLADFVVASLVGVVPAGSGGAVAAAVQVLAVLAGVLGLGLVWRLVSEWWLGRAQSWTARLLHATGSSRWPLPAARLVPARQPRDRKVKVVDGLEMVSAESAGDYPLDVRSVLVGPEVVAGLVAPQSGALHTGGGGDRRQVPPSVLALVGPVVGLTEDGPIHLPAADAAHGLAITGGPNTGKTLLTTALWATDACDRAQPSGRPGMVGARNAMVFFDSKGDEVATLRRWAATARDRVVVVDVGDPSTPGIDFFDGVGTAGERSQLFLNAMIYANDAGAIQGRSKEVLDAVLTGAVAVDDQVLVVAAEQPGFAGVCPEGVELSRVQLAHVLCGGRGDGAGSALFAAIAGEAVRRGSRDRVGAADLLEASQKLSVFYAGPSESARRSTTEAARNKLNQLVLLPFWWAPSRLRVSWSQVLEQHLSVVVNLGTSATGRVVDDELRGELSAMMFYLLRNAIQRMCSGWQAQGRAVSIYSDELAMVAAHSEGVLEWLRDQGRSYGVRLRLATQRPSQLPEKVRQAFLTMAALVSFKQEEMKAGSDVAEQLGVRSGDWTAEDVLMLDPFTAVFRCHVGMKRMPAFTMSVPFFQRDMAASVAGWGYVAGDPSGVSLLDVGGRVAQAVVVPAAVAAVVDDFDDFDDDGSDGGTDAGVGAGPGVEVPAVPVVDDGLVWVPSWGGDDSFVEPGVVVSPVWGL